MKYEVAETCNDERKNLMPPNGEESVRMMEKKAKIFPPGDLNLFLRLYRRDESISGADPRLTEHVKQKTIKRFSVQPDVSFTWWAENPAGLDGLWAPSLTCHVVLLGTYVCILM